MSICDIGIPDLSLRHLKAALYVARDKSVTRAANKLNRSQTAITKAINDLEAQLGVPLFDRSATGMLPTAHGAAMVARVALAEAEFAAAEKAYRNFIQKPPGNNPVFSLEISYKRLAAFIALYESGDINVAAGMLGVTRAAVYNSTRQLEDLLEITLFEREPNGFAPTSYSHVLARHIKLAFSQIRHGLDDLANLSGITRGSVAIGTLPYTRTILTPRAINLLLNDHPQLDVSTREGPYSILEASLRNGDLDFIIGALRTAHSPPDLRTEILFHDRLSIIARKGHPLANCRGLSLHQLTDHQWVLPGRNTPSRQLFDEILCHHGLAAPQHCVETSSLSTLRGLLLESDRIALLSEHQIYYDNQYGLLTALPIELKDSYRPIGVTMRAHTTPSPAAALFLNHLRNVAAEPDSPTSKIENGYRTLSPLPG